MNIRLSSARGIGNIFLILFLTLWVVAFTAANLFFRWTIEQSMVEYGYGITDARWLVQVGYVLIVFIPLLAIFFSIRSQRIKLMLRLWLLGGLLALLSVPAKVFYLTAQNQSNILLTLTLSLLIAVVLLIPRKISGIPGASQNHASQVQRSSRGLDWRYPGRCGGLLGQFSTLWS